MVQCIAISVLEAKPFKLGEKNWICENLKFVCHIDTLLKMPAYNTIDFSQIQYSDNKRIAL